MFKMVKTLVMSTVVTAVLAVGALGLDGLKAGVVEVSGSLNLRSEANTSCEVVKKLPNGTDLSVFDEVDGFYKVSAGGTVGYASKDFVALKDVMNISNGGGAKVTVDILNLREKPTTDSPVVAKLPLGEVTEIIGINSGWLKVRTNQGTGYISPEYVEYVPVTDSIVPPVSNMSSNAAASTGTKGEEVIAYAKQFIGTPYVYGGSSPNGFDCSGFTSYVYKKFGISLSRTSSGQMSNGSKVDKSDLQPGDLVFFTSSSSSKTVSHVGIYVGSGNFIHAVKPGKSLTIDTLTSGYYNTYYWAARRVLS